MIGIRIRILPNHKFELVVLPMRGEPGVAMGEFHDSFIVSVVCARTKRERLGVLMCYVVYYRGPVMRL
jgi:hypothetical protein